MQTNSGPDPPPGNPAFIPDHTLLRCIGRGSYGEVWLARNMMGMYRAVKIVYRKSFLDERPFQRELSGIRKFEPISRSHEGFVDVLQVGINEPEGYFYYVMELGDDQTAGQKIDPENYNPKTLAKELLWRWRLSFQECLQLGLALSQALAELHKHELVHRDVKPSNIIFVNGVPKLADIGLVAEVSEARSYVGTEGFIPPEGPGTPRADVYGLGKVLYEASTGKDRQEFPDLPTQFEKFPDHDAFLELNEVIVHACRNETRERYASAWDMHADLLVLANGKSVKRLKLLERRLSRLKRTVGIAALVVMALAAIGYQVYRERRAVVESRQRQVGANIAYGNRAVEAGDLLGALPYFAEALRLDQGNSKQETAHRLRFGSILAQCPKLTHMWFAEKEVNDGVFSPDGQRILVAEYWGKARIFDTQTGTSPSRPFGHVAGLTGAAYSQDGRFAVTASEGGSACVWDVGTLSEVCHLSHPDRVSSASFSVDHLRIVTSCLDGLARVWDWSAGRTNQPLFSLAHNDAVLFADFSHDGRLMVTTSKDKTARIWSAEGLPVGPPLGHGSWVTSAAFSPDGQKLATACLDHKARVWEVATGRNILPDLNHRDGVMSVEFSPDGRLIVTASLDGTARLWLADTLQPVGSNPVLRHGERLTHATFSPDSRRLVTTCTDGAVRIWDLARGATLPPATRCSYSGDGSQFLVMTNDGIQIEHLASNQPVVRVIAGHRPIASAAFSRNGRFVAGLSAQTNALGVNRVLQVCDTANGEAIAPGLILSNAPAAFALSQDGRRLAIGWGRMAQTWDVLKRTALSPPMRHDDAVRSVAFDPNGVRLGTRSGNTIRLWDAVTGQPCFAPLKLLYPVSFFEFSNDGSLLVACCSNGQFDKCYAQVWNAISGKPVGPRLLHRDGVLFAAFSPDSRRLVTASEDFTAIVWDDATGQQLVPALQHGDQVQSAVFSPDGHWVVTASSDYTARVWNAENGDPLTPPLSHPVKLMNAMFLADGRHIATTDLAGLTRKWELPIDERSVADLAMLARLLSGNSVTTAGQLTSRQPESLEMTWRRLRAKQPSDFVVSDEEIMAWHKLQADDSERHQQWFATAFHLEQLLAIQPGDPSLVERLNRAKEKLRNHDTAASQAR